MKKREFCGFLLICVFSGDIITPEGDYMANVFDYINWRGDLSMTADGFNTVDAVILSRLSYLQLDGIVSSGTALTIREAADRFFAYGSKTENVLWKGDAELLRAAADSGRFGGLKITNYVNIVDGSAWMQFAALTVALPDGRRFISYRGTDNTVVGWQEDFYMFCHFPFPSQKKALAYLEAAAEGDGRLILGGHSKGGNLAVYAASFCTESIRERIDAVYSLDGPGFERKSLEGSGFCAIKERIHTLVPQSSVFGMLFEHMESYTVVRSSRRGFLQHDIYSWDVERTELITLPQTTATSVFFDRTLKEFIDGMSAEEKQRLISGLYELVTGADVDTFDEMADNLLKSIAKMLGSIKSMKPETRALILSQSGKLIKSAGKNLFKTAKQKKRSNQNTTKRGRRS